MQIESLKVFCDLTETKSFTRAAHINNVTQSAVSQTVSALERRFKTPLIERSKRNFRLTPEGDVFYEGCKRILMTCDALRSRLQEIGQVVVGHLRVATTYSIGLHVLPPHVKRFMLRHPGVQVHVEYRRNPQVYENVLGNIVDLGLVSYPVRDARLRVVPFRKDTLVLICHPQHPLAGQKSVRVKALRGVKFINFAKGLPTRLALDALFKRQRVAVDSVMQFDNIETIKQAVEIGAGISILPEPTVRLETRVGTLVAVRLIAPQLQRPIAIIHRRRKVFTPTATRFLELLREVQKASLEESEDAPAQ